MTERKTQLSGRVALVTGGTEGIGRSIAEGFLKEGASVAVTGRSPERGERLLTELGHPENLHFIAADGTRSEDSDRAADDCQSRFGGLDILVNNVGGPSSQFGKVHELTNSGWEDGFVINVHSAFWATRAALPTMVAGGWGRIINISSVEGKMATMAAISPYVASKHALAGLTKAVALEYGEAGITCNSICPSFIETPSKRQAREVAASAAGMTYSEFVARFAIHTMTGVLPTADQVAAVAILMASENGSGITGAQWSVDCGTAQW